MQSTSAGGSILGPKCAIFVWLLEVNGARLVAENEPKIDSLLRDLVWILHLFSSADIFWVTPVGIPEKKSFTN